MSTDLRGPTLPPAAGHASDRSLLPRFRDLSIWLKCLIGPALSVTALAIIAWVAFDATSRVHQAEHEREQVVVQADLLNAARGEIERANGGIYRAITWRANNVQALDIRRVVIDVAVRLTRARAWLEQLAQNGRPNPIIQDYQPILQQLDRYREAIDQVVELLGEDYFLAMMFLNGAEVHYADLEVLLAEADAAAVAANRKKNRAMSEIITSSVVLVMTAIAIEFLATSLVGFAVARAISRPVLSIVASLDRLRAGELALAVPHTERRDEIGRVAQAVTEFRDTLRRTRVLEQAEREKREAELALKREREVNVLQRQFISMVSHEFRTPLAVIDSAAQRLLRHPEKATPERLTGTLGRIRNSVSLLIELMESVLTSARLEEGRIDFVPGSCALRDLVAEVCANYREANRDRAIMVDLGNLPASIHADSRLLRQVISNLVSNAVKYSSVGSPVWVTGHTDPLGEAIISVRDEGVGIPEDELAKLFARFFRASTSAGIPGSGIGLHLAKHFVEMHGGRVEVSSVIDEGTIFTLHLPSQAPDSQERPDEGAELPAAVRA